MFTPFHQSVLERYPNSTITFQTLSGRQGVTALVEWEDKRPSLFLSHCLPTRRTTECEVPPRADRYRAIEQAELWVNNKPVQTSLEHTLLS